MAHYMRTRARPLTSILFVAYVVVGALVANSHGYFRHVTGLKDLISAVLAVLLWPLILGKVNLHIR